jgi:hypothetical protein
VFILYPSLRANATTQNNHGPEGRPQGT